MAREEDGDACALARGREGAVDMTPRGRNGRRSSRESREAAACAARGDDASLEIEVTSHK